MAKARSFRPLAEWCYTCCTDHRPGPNCPGTLLATGEERHGWRARVVTQFGAEIYGVLVAESHGLWRARIITYPNILWILPGGGSLKFVGSDPRDAEKQGIDFIKRHCKLRGLTIDKKLPAVENGAVAPEYEGVFAAALRVESATRKIDGLRLKFGVGHVTEEAITDNYSEGGMFVRTDAPLPADSSIQIQLELRGLLVPLHGIVQWVRAREGDGRPAGMGVKLHHPAPPYIHFVRQRLQTSPAETPVDEVAGPAGS